MTLEHRTILLTGASRGIGAASATELARRGAHVVMAARSLDPLEERAAAIRSAGGRATAIRLDVTRDDSVRDAIAEIAERVGPLDFVVNNAGNGGTLGLWHEESAKKTREMLEVHFFGMERVTRAVVPAMIARGHGTIVNVVSAIAWAPMAGGAVYCSAKAAVLAFSQALRGELAPHGVDVLVFAPGHTKSGAEWPIETGQILTTEEVARDLAGALEHKRRTFVSGLSNKNLVLLQRFFPSLAAKIITKIGLDAIERTRARLPA
jgi:short-subunit dehydrogenase